MAQINCTVERRYLRMEQTVDVTTGSIGSIQCSFSFDGEWEGLQKTAIFKAADNQTYPVLLANDSCTVPNEAICDGHYLTMGVMGTRDGNVVIATEWQNGDLNTGCYTAIAPPSEDIYLQILNEFSAGTARVEAAAQKVQQSADEIKASLPAIHQDAETAKAKAAEAATAAGEAAQSRDKAKEYQDAAQASASDALASAQAATESEENTAAMQSEVQRLAGQVSADKADVTSKAQTVALQAQQVQEYAEEAAKNLPLIRQDAATAEAKAAEATASAAKAKTSETNAKASEISSNQNLSDFLAMLGTDVATLVGGKIPAEQIPAIATTEVYTAATAGEMTALVAQNGDICIRTDENKSYIYKDTGWVYLASPTDYASNAGHANTADNAVNASMINNHRMVEMTAEEFQSAVKDPDTYYLVG